MHNPSPPPKTEPPNTKLFHIHDFYGRPRRTPPPNLLSLESACPHHRYGPIPPFSPTFLMPAHPSCPTLFLPYSLTPSFPFRLSLIFPHQNTICSGVSSSSPHLGHSASSTCPALSSYYTTSRCPFLLATGSNLLLPSASTRVRPSPDTSSSAAWPTALYPPQTSNFRGHPGHPLRSIFCQHIGSLIPEDGHVGLHPPQFDFLPPSLISAILLTTFCRCRDLAFPVLPALLNPSTKPHWAETWYRGLY